jgi:signal transduction histidine kinase
MPSGGVLELSAHTEASDSAAGESGGERVAFIVVRDNGHGMAEDVRKRAFEDFFTTREASGGTGLGLSSVKRFVADSGGTIVLESELGRGTTVKIRLPPAKRSS